MELDKSKVLIFLNRMKFKDLKKKFRERTIK